MKKPARKPARKRAPKSVAKAGSTSLQFGFGPSVSWQTSLFGSFQPPGTLITEPFTGAWQSNISMVGASSPLAFSAVYCCVTGIASDIGKLPIDLMRETPDGVWERAEDNSPFWPVLRKPNTYQTRIQFLEQWIISKLLSGNTYIGLERDNRGIVNRMYVLDPMKVKPLIAADGSVYYWLGQDILNTITDSSIIVPASEIIHDRMECLWGDPLIGVSPLFACAATVGLGNAIQANSQTFFANASQPGGMLSAPGRISNETAERMKTMFEQRFSGANRGRLFVAGDGLTFLPFAMTADQAQLVDQLNWSVLDVARAFHYPVYKLDSSKLPPYSGNNIQTLNMQYLGECLQKHIEAIELLIETAFTLPSKTHIQLDTDVLLRMDQQTLFRTIGEGTRGGVLAPNEGRLRANLSPVKGGEFPRMQMQYVSLPMLDQQQQQQNQQPVPREFVADVVAAAMKRELEMPDA